MKKIDIFSSNITQQVRDNHNYNKVIYTSDCMQIVAVNLKPGEDIENEVHRQHDQFGYIVDGVCELVTGLSDNEKKHNVIESGSAFMIPHGTWHQIINKSNKDNLKLYSIYSPPIHPSDYEVKDRPESVWLYTDNEK